jgi:hypothetical protein
MADRVRLSDIEALFTCKARSKRSAEVRPAFWHARPAEWLAHFHK